jgi:hypothetical protein
MWQDMLATFSMLLERSPYPTTSLCSPELTIMGTVVKCPGICPGQRFTVFPDWLKGLGDVLGHAVWGAMELYRNLEEEARTL